MAKKDSYWFKHDSSAGRGLRMRKMAHIHGHWGKGIYWDVIEILRDQSNYSFEADDHSLRMLSDLIGCKDADKFIEWFNDCIKNDLLTINKGRFYSEVLCKNMGNWETKKANGSRGGRPEIELDEEWKRAMSEKYKIQVSEWLNRFDAFLIGKPKHKSIQKYKEHFCNWMNKQNKTNTKLPNAVV